MIEQIILSIILIILILYFIAFAFNFFILKHQVTNENKYVFIFLITLILWLLSVVSFSLTSNEKITLLFARLAWGISPFLSTGLINLAINYPNPKKNKVLQEKLLISILYGTSAIIFYYSITTQLTVIKLDPVLKTLQYGKANSIISLYLIVSIVTSIIILLKKLKKTTGLKKEQIKYFILGITVSSILTIVNNIIIPKIIHTSRFSVLGGISSSFIALGITIAYAKTKLHNIRIFYKTLIVGSVKFILLLASFYTVIYIIKNRAYIIINLIILALILIPLFTLIDRVFNKIFANLTLYNPIKARDLFIERLSKTRDLPKLILLIEKSFIDIFRTPKVHIVIFNTKYKKIIDHSKGMSDKKSNPPYRSILNLFNYLKKEHPPILSIPELTQLKTEIKSNSIKIDIKRIIKHMQQSNFELVLPINRKVNQNGFILLGPKGNNESYTIEDRQLIESIIGFIGIAVQNSLVHEQLQKQIEIVNSFNKTLQKEVKLATSKLQKQLDKMKEIRRKEQDMMDIMGHELRTPLSVVKNAIDLLKMTHSAGTLNDEVFNKYINMADDNAKREIRLLETMLAATKFDKKKMQFNLTKVDFIELANTSLLAFTKKAKEKGLQLTFKKPKQKHLYILADRDRAQEVIDNLVDNAIKYTEKGSVTITLKEEGRYIKLSVKDTGIGISKKDIKKLGRKFFRAQQYLNDDDKKAPSIVRPGGTGLGLYVVFSLIKGMKGKYKVESELGKGSNFIVWLPKFKEK